MHYCPSCAQEIPASATVCDHCGRPTAQFGAAAYEFADQPLDEADEPLEEIVLGDDIEPIEESYQPVPSTSTAMPAPETVSPPAQARFATPSRRELLAIAAAVVGGGTITLGILIAAGRPSSDSASARVQSAAVQSANPAAHRLPSVGGAKWHAGNRAWLGQRKGVAFELPGDNKIAVWQKNVQPTLVVRCLTGQPEVFVFTDSAARIETQDENHTVRIGFDDGPELTERWPDSADHDALFAPDGTAFARRLMQARTMRFAFTPHNASTATVTFQVSGFADLMASAARQCGVKH